MKKFNIKVGDRKFIVSADNEAKAVKKLKDAQAKKLKDAEPIIVEAVPYKNEMYVVLEFSWDGHKRWIVVAKENYHGEKKFTGGGTVEYSFSEAKKTADDFYIMNKLDKKYGTKEGYKKWMKGETDSAEELEVKDSKYVDTEHYADYGWTIARDLARSCYWEAVEELAGTLKTEQDYIREITKLAKSKFEQYIKAIKNDFEKRVNEGRSQTAEFAKWAPEQARAIMKKQENR